MYRGELLRKNVETLAANYVANFFFASEKRTRDKTRA